MHYLVILTTLKGRSHYYPILHMRRLRPKGYVIWPKDTDHKQWGPALNPCDGLLHPQGFPIPGAEEEGAQREAWTCPKPHSVLSRGRAVPPQLLPPDLLLPSLPLHLQCALELTHSAFK